MSFKDRAASLALIATIAAPASACGDAVVPTTLPARRPVRQNARLAGTMWFLASFIFAVASIWIALAYFV